MKTVDDRDISATEVKTLCRVDVLLPIRRKLSNAQRLSVFLFICLSVSSIMYELLNGSSQKFYHKAGSYLPPDPDPGIEGFFNIAFFHSLACISGEWSDSH